MIISHRIQFRHFIKTKSSVIILYLVIIVVFALVMFLVQVNKEIISYTIFLCCLITGVYGGLSYIKFSIKYNALRKLQFVDSLKNISLPESSNIIESLYQQIISEVDDELNSYIGARDESLTDLSDYYTLWAHQIKTPVAAMRLLIEDENTDRMLMKQELLKIETYIESALHYVRLENITSDFQFEKVSIDRIIKQVIKKYATFFIYNKISLSYEENNISLISDEKWLLFIFEQIISNALKYTKKGSIEIQVIKNPKNVSNSEEYDKISVVIRDTGIGIREEDLDKVFDKGFTGFNGRMDKRSTGIGLYLSKKVCEKLGYRIAVSSKIDEGTSVTLQLYQSNLTYM